MTPSYINEKVRVIRHQAERGDFEAAHMSEITLMKEFIDYVAEDGGKTGRDGLRQLAKNIKKSFTIPFTRVTS